VTFLGGLHWPPNAAGLLWFFQECWPRVRQMAPQAVLTVIGRDPPPEVATAPHDHIDVTGYVDDPVPYLRETAALIVPLHAGGGMRVKIVDAWAWGLPVVSTTIGAEGLRYTARENVLIADTAQDFAQAVVRLLEDRELGERLAAAGRQTAEQHYDWRAIYRTWDDIYAADGGNR
jgi:glycosyltransferase involved in cell wall biosynthesis